MPARSKYTVKAGDAICKLIEYGVTIEAAAESEGVSRQTIYNWRDAGRAGTSKAMVQFAAQLERALAAAETRLTLNVINRAKDDWRAGAWWLERRRPDVYGDRSRHDVPTEGREGKADVQFYLPDNGRRPHK